MTIAVGVFDLFTYAIPGSLYLALLGYVAVRLDWVDPGTVATAPAVLLVIGLVLMSYLLGYLAYPIGAALDRMIPRLRKRRPRQEFLGRSPAARDLAYVRADPFLLFSAVQLHDKDVAVEIARLRAGGLMLRNSAPPLLLGLVAAIVELILSSNRLPIVGCAVLLAAAPVSLITQGRRLGHWASLKTLELCFWLPDVEERLRVDANQDGTRHADAQR